MQRFLYSGYILKDESIGKLKDLITTLGLELYDNVYLHHCTIDVNEEVNLDKLLRLSRTLIISGLVVGEFAMAFTVKDAYLSNNEEPHITVCTKQGYSPVYSNVLLSSDGPPSNYYSLNIEVEVIIQNIYSK